MICEFENLFVKGPPIRIAAVSNIQQMLLAKKKIQEKINQGLKVNERTTIAQTVAHGSTRKAHVPVAVQVSEKKLIYLKFFFRRRGLVCWFIRL